jgi:hypothetical protein
MKKQLFETQEESATRKKTMRECVTKQQHTEMEEQGAKRKKTIRESVTKQQHTETEEQGAKRKKTMRECMTKQQQTETEKQGDKRKKTNQDCLRRKREEMRHQLQNDRRECNGEDMTNVFDRAMKEVKTNYTGHKIQQTPICIRQLCVLYAIVSLLAQKPFTNFPRKTLGHTVKDLVSKVTKSTTRGEITVMLSRVVQWGCAVLWPEGRNI